MATNRGILNVLQKLWPHVKKESVTDVRELMEQPPGQSMALDHYRKMCGGCHLWKARRPKLGEIGKRGGGCTDCHLIELSVPDQDFSQKRFKHPQLTTRIPNSNCLKCHNRSARIGLSYIGRFESEGYGTSFQHGEPGMRRLTGGRFYLELPPDIHYKKAGLLCTDCHTEKGVMGDGKDHQHMVQQVDIRCNSCHDPVSKTDKSDREELQRLIRLNGRQPPLDSGPFFVSPKGSPIYHLRAGEEKKLVLFRKMDGKKIVFKRYLSEKAHDAPYHKRLSCQACHSAWTPQCYGCHETLFLNKKQRDWLSGRKRPGRWVEGRSFLRFYKNILGVWPNGKIGPYAPGCQVFLELFDKNGKYMADQSYRSIIMSSFDPHTTALKTQKRYPT